MEWTKCCRPSPPQGELSNSISKLLPQKLFNGSKASALPSSRRILLGLGEQLKDDGVLPTCRGSYKTTGPNPCYEEPTSRTARPSGKAHCTLTKQVPNMAVEKLGSPIGRVSYILHSRPLGG